MEHIILKLYRHDRNIVNNRTDIIAGVWREMGWVDNRSLEDNLRNLPSAETITRAVRKLHEQGKIEYSKQEDDRRYRAMVNERGKHQRRLSWF